MADTTPFSFEFNPGGIQADIGDNDSFRIGALGEDGISDSDADVLFPGAEPRNQYEPLDPDKVPQIDAVKQDTPEYAARPAEERTRELFAYMRPHRMSLLGILDAAREPVSSARMEEIAEELHKQKFNVYSAANLCTMLETAGALQRVVQDGTPYSQYEPKPDIVLIDGEEYWQPSEAPAVCWLATDAGRLMVDENDPIERMREMFARDAGLLGLYKQVLIATREGATMAQLSEKVDANPLISKPRRFFVQHFVEALERCEALGWRDGRWKTTDIGEKILLELLADVETAQEYAPDARSASYDGASVPTETQGVSW